MTKNEILAWRQDKFQKLIRDKDLAAILFLMPGRDGFDLYFTGETSKIAAPYDGPLQSLDTCVLIKKSDKPTIIHSSYLTEPGAPDPLLTHSGPRRMGEEMYRWCLNQKSELYIDALETNKRLGVVNFVDMREELYEFITSLVSDVEFIDVTKDAHCLKAEKCLGDLEFEIESVRRIESVFNGTYAFIHPAKFERDIANDIRAAGEKLEHFTKFTNLYSDWVVVHMTSAPDGGNATEGPLPYPGRMVEFGDRININILAALNNDYSAGLGRCYVIGEPCDETKRYWDLAVQAQDAAARIIKPGATIADAVRNAIEEVYKPNGLTYRPSNWIFALGLNFTMAEFPMAIPGWENMPLCEGMFLCIAPRIELSGKDPYCCMDTYVVTKNGCERLTKMKREIIDLYNVKLCVAAKNS